MYALPRFIQTMRDDLSEVGQTRAWIHLALEKKMLSQHLKELLTNQELLRSESSLFIQAVSFVNS